MNDFLYSSGFLRSPLGPSSSPGQCRCVSGSHASRVPAAAFVSVGLGGRLPPWYAQSPLGLRSVTHTLAAKARLMP